MVNRSSRGGPVRRTLRWARRLVLALLLPVLLLAAFGHWWLLPRLNDYRDDLAAILGDYLRFPVRIEAVTGVRDGWRLGLRLRGVALQDPASGAVLASFTQAAATLSLWHSLWEWRPVFGHIRLEGANLTLEQGPDGTPRLLAGDAIDAAPPLPDVLRWLFGLRRLEIVGEQLIVRRPDGDSLRLLHPYLQLHETGPVQRLAFVAELPAGLGDRVQFTIERQRPDGADPEAGQGAFQLRADRLNLAGWPLPLAFAAGQAAMSLRGEWRDWQPSRLEANLRLRGATLNREPRSALLGSWLARLPESELMVDWRRQETGWQLWGQARFGNGRGQVVARPLFELSRTSEQWQGSIRDLDAGDVLAWVTPWLDEPARQWLIPLDPRGGLPEITVRVEPAAGVYSATAKLRGVTFRPVRGLPGFDNVTGTLEMGPNGGRLELDSREVQVDTDGLLRAPAALDVMAGTVNWRRDAGVLRLESDGLQLASPDLGGRIWGSVTVPDAGEPVLDLQAHYQGEFGVGRAPRYLPVTVIPPDGVAWLDRALVSGRVVAGELVLRGHPVDFPFDRDEGVFETRFQIQNAVLDYAPGWPQLDRLWAAVTFRNRGLRVESGVGRLLDGDVDGATARIDDLETPVVHVRGRARGPGASMWQALRDSPVGRDMADDLPDLRFTGSNTLDLELTIPTDARPNQVRGRVGLLDGGVNLSNWNMELSRLRGEVRFTEASLEARDVRAMVRGEPVNLDLDLAGREGQRELRARLRGRLGARALAGESAPVLEPYFNGKSAWDAALAVPVGRRERRNAMTPFSLDLNSDLRGIAVRLPAPLGKTAGETRPLRIGLSPGERGALELNLEYGSNIRAALALGGLPNGLRLDRGELRINAGMARLPEAPGLAVIASLPRWELALPGGAADSESSRPGSGSGPVVPASDSGGPASVLRSLDARIGELVVAGQSFPGVTVRMVRDNTGMRVDLDSERLAGRVTVPDQPTPEQPINAALQRLYLRRAGEGAAEPSGRTGSDPGRLPPLVLTAADLRLDSAALGRLRLVAVPRAGGIRLTEIDLSSDRQRIQASGEWLRTIGGQTSRFRATLHSQGLGETLSALGYSRTGIARGETEAELDLEWAAPLPDVALDRIEGRLKFEVGSGQLLDVDPGMGRMVGLFSLQNLIRRLSLDFSDLFQPGMGFDRISGEFTFGNGQAFTDNLMIEAPAAQILIQGRTGLTARDYDQRITVTPRLGGALPVAGALAGGPAVGAAVLLAERLLRKGIEDATRYRYVLKGSWDDPVLEPLQQ